MLFILRIAKDRMIAKIGAQFCRVMGIRDRQSVAIKLLNFRQYETLAS